ncbi:hypothetical protein J4204_05465 [Candidatus Woesearchaeota archaeon]|nr:hypothetical protein [Candidatus Woesearchaeota archaeon]
MAKKLVGFIAYTALVALFIILSIDFYLSREHYDPSIDAFLGNSEKYEGKYSKFAGPVINVSGSSFYMRVNQRPLKVYHANLEKPKFGQVYVWARLNSDGTAEAIEVHNFSYNYAKYFLSFFAFILFLLIFFREWKFKGWRLVENA